MRLLTLFITPYIIIWLLTRSRRTFRWIFLTALLTIQLFSLLPLVIVGIVVMRQPAVTSMALAGIYRSYTVTNSQLHGLSGWEGVDIKAGCGEPIYAPFAGTVTYNGLDGYNHEGVYEQSTMLTIKNDYLEMTLLHGDYLPPVGSQVQKGEMIGTENTHGWSTGCHSHVIWRDNGRLVNYLEWSQSNTMLAKINNAPMVAADYPLRIGASSSMSNNYFQLVRRVVAEVGASVEPELVMGIIQQESAWNPNATSSSGAMGLMQLMPGTAADMGVANAYDPEQNIRGGVKYITWLMSRYNGDMRRAVMAYHAGPGNLENRGPTSLDIYYANQVMGYYEGYLNERR